MLTLKEKAINNTFQVVEDLKTPEIKRSLYYSSTKARPPLRAQLPGKVKVFSEGEVFLYRLRKYRQALQEGRLWKDLNWLERGKKNKKTLLNKMGENYKNKTLGWKERNEALSRRVEKLFK